MNGNSKSLYQLHIGVRGLGKAKVEKDSGCCKELLEGMRETELKRESPETRGRRQEHAFPDSEVLSRCYKF